MDRQHTATARRFVALVIVAAALSAFTDSSTATSPPSRQPPVVVKVDGGFRWVDAGLGAASALAAVLPGLRPRARREGLPGKGLR